MPKFYFRRVHGRSWIDDLEGIDLPDLDWARREAEARASQIVFDGIEADRVQVVDEAGTVLLNVPLPKDTI